jgi:two-component system chemotaxis response regulator CheB
VAGIAANGRIALGRIPQVNPDVVVLDVEMPEMDGLETLVEIRKAYPRLPVIMFSSLTERGATTTLDALTRGASDYVTKPTSAGSVSSALEQVREQLVPKIQALCGGEIGSLAHGAGRGSLGPPRAAPADRSTTSRALATPSRLPPAARFAPHRAGTRIEMVAIGASTGGPNALSEVLSAIPEDFPAPILVTQHMPPMFTRLLAERLDAKCALSVKEAEPGAVVETGSVWIARGDHHMTLERDGQTTRLVLNQAPPENACRPAVDVMLRSVASVYGERALAVILTGMGQDGMRGAELIRERGGLVFAQDEATSVVWGMPGFVARNGLANRVLALPDVAPAMKNTVASFRDSPTDIQGRGMHAN